MAEGQTMDGLFPGKKEKAPTVQYQGDIVEVVNRSGKPFEWQHNGLVYRIEANGTTLCAKAPGLHGYKRSAISLDPISNEAVFRLGVRGYTDCTPLEEKASESRPELLDRTSGMEDAKFKNIVNPVGNERASRGGSNTIAGPESVG